MHLSLKLDNGKQIFYTESLCSLLLLPLLSVSSFVISFSILLMVVLISFKLYRPSLI